MTHFFMSFFFVLKRFDIKSTAIADKANYSNAVSSTPVLGFFGIVELSDLSKNIIVYFLYEENFKSSLFSNKKPLDY